jgi:hypothetical protein
MSYYQEGHIKKFCEGVKCKIISNLIPYSFVALVQ